jgi:hypothetical protein
VLQDDLNQSGHLPSCPISGHSADPGNPGRRIIFVLWEFILTFAHAGVRRHGLGLHPRV